MNSFLGVKMTYLDTLCALSPCALTKNFVKVQSLGSETVLCSLFVITLWHVLEQIVSCKVNVVDDLAKILVEVGIGQTNKVVQSVLRNISLPLKFTFSFFTDGPKASMCVHPGLE